MVIGSVTKRARPVLAALLVAVFVFGSGCGSNADSEVAQSTAQIDAEDFRCPSVDAVNELTPVPVVGFDDCTFTSRGKSPLGETRSSLAILINTTSVWDREDQLDAYIDHCKVSETTEGARTLDCAAGPTLSAIGYFERDNDWDLDFTVMSDDGSYSLQELTEIRNDLSALVASG